MSIDDCVQEMLDLGIKAFSKDEIKAYLKALDDQTKNLSPEEKLLSTNQVLERANNLMISRQQIANIQAKAISIQTTLQVESAISTIQGFAKTLKPLSDADKVAGKKQEGIYDAFLRWFQGSTDLKTASRGDQSVVGTVEAWQNYSREFFAASLSKDGGAATVAWKDADAVKSAIDAFWSPKATRQISGLTKEVQAFVGTLDSLTDFSASSINDAGGYVLRRPTLLFSARSARADLVSRLSKDDFINAVKPRLTTNKQELIQAGLDSEEAVLDRLSDLYNRLSDGKQYTSSGAYFDGMGPMVKSTFRNYADSMSDSVFDIPFATGKDFLEFHDQFNGGDIRDYIEGQVHHLGRNVGLTTALGPVPEATYNAVRKRLLSMADPFDHARLKGDTTGAAFNQAGGGIKGTALAAVDIAKSFLLQPSTDDIFKVLTGEADRVENFGMAQFMSSARGYTAVVKLPFGHISQYMDLPVIAATMHRFGDTPLSTFGDTLANTMRTYFPKDQAFKEAAGDLYAGLYGFHGKTHSNFLPSEVPLGKVREYTERVFDLNGMRNWDVNQKAGVGFMMSRGVARHAQTPFDALEAGDRAFYEAFGFNADKWSKLRAGMREMVDFDGQVHIIPEKLDKGTRQAYMGLITEMQGIAVPTPKTVEKALITRGTRPGTATGELMRSIGLFKSFTDTLTRKVLPHIMYTDGKRGMIQYMTMSIPMYLATQQMRNWASGKTGVETYKWDSPDTWVDLMGRSGLGGVYGDLLMGDYNEHGGGTTVAEYFGGPLIGGVGGDLGKLVAGSLRGTVKGTDFVKTADKYSPLRPITGMPILQPVYNQFILYNIMDAIEPGWSSEMTQRLENRTGQRRLFSDQ